MTPKHHTESPKRKFLLRLYVLATLAAVMIGVQVANAITGGKLAHTWGIWPRHFSGLTGIILAPWLHGSWGHLFSNLPGLLVFSAISMWPSIRRFILLSAWIILASGTLVWIFGRNSIHIGASGWLFGLWAWLIVRAFYQRNFSNIGIALIIVIFYGGMGWGLLPHQGVSVESHISGALCGALAAWVYHKRPAS